MKTHPYLKPGDLMATHDFFSVTRPLSPLSLTIRVVTASHWNHIACVDLIDGELQVVEAWYPRCRHMPLQQWLDRGEKDILRLRPKDEAAFDYPFYHRVLMDAVGKNELGDRPGVGYDVSALFAQAEYRITGEKKWKGRGEKTAHLKYYCSELGLRSHRRPDWWMGAPVEVVEDAYFDQFELRRKGIGTYV